MKVSKKKTIWILAVVLAVVAIGGFIILKNKNQVQPNLYRASFGNLIQELSFTGKVKPAEEVELAFEKSGRIENVFVDVGEKVTAGDVLAKIDSSGIEAELEKAEANLYSEEIKLEELRRGVREEELKIYQAKVDSAKVSVEESEKSLFDKISDAYTKSDDSIRNRIDKFFTDPRSQTPVLNLSPVESQLKTDLEFGRLTIENMLKAWVVSLSGMTGSSNSEEYSLKAKNNLNLVKNFLDKAALAVNSMTANASFSQTTIDGYKTEVSAARVNINTAITNLSAADEKLKTSQSSLFLAERELELSQAGSSAEAIKSQEAKAAQAKAGVSSIEADLNKYFLSSPINGVVSKKNISLGEIAQLSQSAFSVISSSGFEIEANIAEIDIAKINLGQSAKVTLDAYGSLVEFPVKVAKVDPAETMVEGVPTYRTKLVFEKPDERIKSGMTANIEIVLELRNNVLVIPQKAISTKNGGKFVQVFYSGKIIEKEIKTGAKSTDGKTEVLSGLMPGEEIVLP